MAKVTRAPSPLLTPAPPVLVSCGSMARPNLITIGWTGVVCSDPPMVTVSVTPQRFSHNLIAETGLTTGKLLALLTMLELKGVVKRLPGKRITLK